MLNSRRLRTQRASRRGVVAVEAAAVLPVLLIMMLGLWEVGRLIQVDQVLTNAAREGARVAAGGYVNGTPVTVAMVKQAVKDYMTSSGFPTATVNGAQISLSAIGSSSWTDPYQALPLDPFQVSITIPSGTAFDSLRWTALPKLTPVQSLSVTVQWASLNDTKITVGSQLPY